MCPTKCPTSLSTTHNLPEFSHDYTQCALLLSELHKISPIPLLAILCPTLLVTTQNLFNPLLHSMCLTTY